MNKELLTKTKDYAELSGTYEQNNYLPPTNPFENVF